MNLNTIAILVLLFFGYVWYSIYSLKNKCSVLYTRVTGQEIERMVTIKGRQIDFDGKRFDLLPERKRLVWKAILGIFGTWVIRYHLVWYARYPEDPDVYNLPVSSPEVRHAMNQEEKFRAFMRAEQQHLTNKKSSGWAQYLPWVAVLGIVVIGVMMWNMNGHINFLDNYMRTIPKP